jgi:hypothetical protein
MLGTLFGYFFCMITVLAAAVVLMTGVSNISTLGNGRHHSPVISRTVTVELQRHSPVAKEASSPAKDISPVVSVAKADTNKTKHYKPKVFARHPNYKPVFARHPNNNYGYGNALGYAEESGYRSRGFFFR